MSFSIENDLLLVASESQEGNKLLIIVNCLTIYLSTQAGSHPLAESLSHIPERRKPIPVPQSTPKLFKLANQNQVYSALIFSLKLHNSSCLCHLPMPQSHLFVD